MNAAAVRRKRKIFKERASGTYIAPFAVIRFSMSLSPFLSLASERVHKAVAPFLSNYSRHCATHGSLFSLDTFPRRHAGGGFQFWNELRAFVRFIWRVRLDESRVIAFVREQREREREGERERGNTFPLLFF